MFTFIVLGLVSSVLSQDIGRERLQNDLFCVEWDTAQKLTRSFTESEIFIICLLYFRENILIKLWLMLASL